MWLVDSDALRLQSLACSVNNHFVRKDGPLITASAFAQCSNDYLPVLSSGVLAVAVSCQTNESVVAFAVSSVPGSSQAIDNLKTSYDKTSRLYSAAFNVQAVEGQLQINISGIASIKFRISDYLLHDVLLPPPIPVQRDIPRPLAPIQRQADPPSRLPDSPLLRSTFAESERAAGAMRKSLKALVKSLEHQQAVFKAYEDALFNVMQAMDAVKLPSPFDRLSLEYLKPRYEMEANRIQSLHLALSTQLLVSTKRYIGDLAINNRKSGLETATKQYYSNESRFLSSLPAAEASFAQLNLSAQFQATLGDYNRYLELLNTQGATDFGLSILKYCEGIRELDSAHAYPVANLTAVLRETDLALHLSTGADDSDFTVAEEPAEAVPPHLAVSRKRRFSWSPRLGSPKQFPLSEAIPISPTLSARMSPVRRKEGYLYTQNHSSAISEQSAVGANLKRVWTTVASGHLQTYDLEKMQPNSPSINLKYASAKIIEGLNRPFLFEIITTDGKRLFQAVSREERTAWLDAIHLQIEAVLSGKSSVAVRHRSFSEDDVSMGSGTVGARTLFSNLVGRSEARGHKRIGSRQLLKLDKITRSRQRSSEIAMLPEASKSMTSLNSANPDPLSFSLSLDQISPLLIPDQDIEVALKALAVSTPDRGIGDPKTILHQLLELPDNQSCFECRLQERPKWASYSLGVFLCVACAGIHRSLGTSISRVRAIDLDEWSLDQLHLLQEIGNGRAAKLYPEICTGCVICPFLLWTGCRASLGTDAIEYINVT